MGWSCLSLPVIFQCAKPGKRVSLWSIPFFLTNSSKYTHKVMFLSGQCFTPYYAYYITNVHCLVFRHLRMPVPPGFPQPPVAGAQAPAPPAAGPSPQSNAATPNQSTTQPPIPPNPPVFGGFPGGFPPMPNFPSKYKFNV